jgi:hypothetical protein
LGDKNKQQQQQQKKFVEISKKNHSAGSETGFTASLLCCFFSNTLMCVHEIYIREIQLFSITIIIIISFTFLHRYAREAKAHTKEREIQKRVMNLFLSHFQCNQITAIMMHI